MKTNIVTRHTTLTPTLETSINSKVEKLNSKFIHDKADITVTVTLDVSKDQHNTQIVLNGFKHVLKSHASTDDMYKSIEKAFKGIEIELKKHKDRTKDVKVRTQQHSKIEDVSILLEEEIEEEE